MGKMAQIGLMNVLAVEGKEHSILVNAISPVAKTRMWNVRDEPEDLRSDQISRFSRMPRVWIYIKGKQWSIHSRALDRARQRGLSVEPCRC
jgi:NAD(P)-dependent dehydrogenase (short-subunit alcohol dehydrogenase family)